MGRKKCFHATEEKEKCMAEQTECSEAEEEEVGDFDTDSRFPT